jgi:MarR family transcriptional regulator, organic hydroperoxide resistance regulator
MEDDPLALERQVCFALATASRSVVKLYRPVLEPLGLTHPQYLVMLALWERSPRSLRDIADALLLEPPTLTPLLKRLEAIGYLERRRNPADERELGVELTEAGRALRDRALEVPVRVAERLGLPVSMLEEARRTLDVLVRAAQEATGREQGKSARSAAVG